MKRTLRTLTLFSMLFLIAVILPQTHAEAASSGTCGAGGDGSNLMWTLDDAGKLTISDNGAMNNCSSSGLPWDADREQIKQVTLECGVTSIGDYSFYG